jgi:tape measure domain-containing protein
MLSGGIFGGPEGAVGGLVGGLFGGPGGALAGAAAGAQVSQLRQQLSGVAEFNAEITLAKTTLAQASTGLQDYNRLLGLARQVSSDYAVSLKPAISGLAQIATAARANNLSFDDTEKIYRGLIASNVAFGKSQEDLDAIIRATVQVLSKGKVSAEELSGQIGERLPGAVAKFAAANDMTLPQLTKAFKDGQVTIAQFVRFAAAQGEEYGEIAEKIAEGPEKAGLRLQIALENSGEIFGSFFAKAGAGFQDFFAQIVTFFNNNEKRVKQFVTNMVNSAVLVAGVIKNVVMGIVNFAKGALDILEKFNPLIKAVRLSFEKGLKDFYDKAPDMLKGAADRFGIKLYSVEDLFPDQTPTSFGKGGAAPSGTGTEDGGGEGDSKAARDLARRIAGSQEVVRRLRDQLEISKQQRPLDEFLAKQAKDRSDFEARFAKLRGDKKNEQIEQAYIDAQALMQKKQEFDLQKFIFDKMKGIGDMKMEHMRLEQDLNRELQDRQYELGLISEEEYKRLQMVRERKRLEDQYPGEGFAGKRAEAEDLYRRQIDPTFKEGAETEVARMERDLEKMTKPLEQLKGAAMAFGESISQAFSNIVTGSQTAQQAMAQFLKNLGQYFVEYAAKVITQMIAIATIQAVIKALGGPSTSGGAGADTSSFQPSNIGDNYSSFITNAGGNAFNKGVKRYAMGGVVNKPTMFTYAEGGTGRFGLMGEAGPEAIIPLKRGNDGRLGVSAYFADANAAMAKGAANRSSSAAFDENAEALALGNSYSRERVMERERQTMLTGAGGSMLIQTQVINNVEYATMDQVAQATAASAKQARAQVFADMRNKPSTRSSLGMR